MYTEFILNGLSTYSKWFARRILSLAMNFYELSHERMILVQDPLLGQLTIDPFGAVACSCGLLRAVSVREHIW